MQVDARDASTAAAEFDSPPPLPPWLEDQLPWRRRRVRLADRRLHFIDDGPQDAPAVLLVHGNPTWCYLWRKVIARLLPQGVRVIAPDLIGFGLSEKPRRVADHTLHLHIDAIHRLVEVLDLPSLTLVGQDWGGPIAAGVGVRSPWRVHGLVFANTGVVAPARPFRPKTFHRLSRMPVASDVLFRGLNFPLPVLPLAQGDRRSIGAVQRRAYRWPFGRIRDRAGPLALARMVPADETDPALPLLDEIGGWIGAYRGPAALVWGQRDPVLGRALRRHRAALPQAEVIETAAGHFLQEEVPDELARAILRVVEADPDRPREEVLAE